jgi:hypothetical protein
VFQIIGLVFLSRYNAKNARLRARSGGQAIGYTIALWLGLETLGALLTLFLIPPIPEFRNNGSVFYSINTQYLVGLLFGAIGAGLSVWLSKHGDMVALQQNNLTPQEVYLLQTTQYINPPCQVIITREPSMAGEADIPLYVLLNGQFIGMVSFNQTIYATTSAQLNIVTGSDKNNPRLPTGCTFYANPGSQVHVVINGSRFIPERTVLY